MINYTKAPRTRAVDPNYKINLVHPTRPRANPTPDADGIVRLRRGESVKIN